MVTRDHLKPRDCCAIKMTTPPPVFSSLTECAQGSQVNHERYKGLVDSFQAKYGEKPKYLVRAPGRVNLIGEHIDYSGYGVLPMALEQDITTAFVTNDSGEICLANVSDSYSELKCKMADIKISGHNWYEYFFCGLKGIVEHFSIDSPIGMKVLLDGNIPPSAGLSSSSALVCCAALATVVANNVPSPTKKELAEICAKCERYIGTEGGGMDQSISFMAEPGVAKMIEFNPIRCSDVKLPSSAAIVVSNTLVLANKAAFANYNERVVECRIAAQVIAKKKGLKWQDIRKLGQLMEALQLSLEKMVTVVAECLHGEAYMRNEVCKFLEVSDEDLASGSMSPSTLHMQKFELHKRAAHVYSESLRVIQFKKACENPSVTMEELGKLMNESHASCRDLYECSCPELDGLAVLCEKSGSCGTRLTGAGWGGCAISLVPKDNVDSFMQRISESFYQAHPVRAKQISTSLFATSPGGGASVCKLE